MPPPTNAEIALRALKERYDFSEENIRAIEAAREDMYLRRLLARIGAELDDPTNRPLQAMQALGLIPPAQIAAIRAGDIQGYNKAILDAQRAGVRSWLGMVARHHAWPEAERVAVEFVTTGSPNGFAFMDPDDGSFGIAIDHAVVTGFDVVAQDALYALYNEQDPEQWIVGLAEMVVSQHYGSPVHGFEERRLALRQRNQSLAPVTELLSEGLWLFVLSHELAHIRLGHLRAEAASAAEGDPEALVRDQSHEQEFAADAWALETVAGIGGPDSLSARHHVMAPPAYFSLACLVAEMYAPRRGLGARRDASHPDPWARAERLKYRGPRGPRGGRAADLVDALIGLPDYVHAQLGNPGFRALAGQVRWS